VSRHDPRSEERESRADPPALAPLQSAHLSPWSDFPTSSRGIRLDIPSFALTTCVVSWLCRPCGPRCLAKSGVVTPLHRHPSRASTPPNRHCCRPGSVPRLPASESRSVLVVLHHLDGFLRSKGCGLVASRCQSWGSPRFVLSQSSRRFSHPSKNSTRPQPHHVTVAVAPLPFPPVPLASSDQLRCQSRPLEIRLMGASASRLCSAVESVTPSDRCQPAGALSFLGFVPLQGPFLRLESTRALLRSPCIGRAIRKVHSVQELRSAPTRLAPRGPHRPPPCGGRSSGMEASARPKTPPSSTWHQTSKMFRRTSPTGKHRRGRSRMMSRIESLRHPKMDQGRGSMRTESLRRFTESRERVSRSPGPDRSQDPGRR